MTRPSLDVLLSDIAENPVALARFAELLLARGQREQAWTLCERAIALAPGDAEVQAIAAPIFSHQVPGYHFVMVRDTERNALYEEVLRRAIRPDSRVLDIGSGTGLFAMMAARAGATEVITCEANPAVAAVVAEVVAKNGLAESVRVVAKHSSDLEVGVDLDGPADVLVFDNVSSSMIADGVLPSMEQAVRRLMRLGATAIPAGGTVRVALAEDRDALRWRMQTVQGFDLSPFNRLASPSISDVGRVTRIWRSAANRVTSFTSISSPVDLSRRRVRSFRSRRLAVS